MTEAVGALTVENVFGGYGGVDILNGLDLRVEPGEIAVIIGPNGAGKSTAIKAIFGLVKVRAGTVVYGGENITGLRPDQIVHRRMCYVPQEHNVFPLLTVHENLEMGAFVRTDDFSHQLEMVYEMFPAMVEKRNVPAGTLSGGQRQMVAIGRALMMEPGLLLLDEPTAGLSPIVMDSIFEKIREINGMGITILMVEQNAKKALSFADRAFVLVMGRKRHEDSGPNTLADPEVAEMFLGGGN